MARYFTHDTEITKRFSTKVTAKIWDQSWFAQQNPEKVSFELVEPERLNPLTIVSMEIALVVVNAVKRGERAFLHYARRHSHQAAYAMALAILDEPIPPAPSRNYYATFIEHSQAAPPDSVKEYFSKARDKNLAWVQEELYRSVLRRAHAFALSEEPQYTTADLTPDPLGDLQRMYDRLHGNRYPEQG